VDLSAYKNLLLAAHPFVLFQMCTIVLFTNGLVIGSTTTFNLWQLPEHLALALARYDAGTRTRGVPLLL
jgi:hypothetical protein